MSTSLFFCVLLTILPSAVYGWRMSINENIQHEGSIVLSANAPGVLHDHDKASVAWSLPTWASEATDCSTEGQDICRKAESKCMRSKSEGTKNCGECGAVYGGGHCLYVRHAIVEDTNSGKSVKCVVDFRCGCKSSGEVGGALGEWTALGKVDDWAAFNVNNPLLMNAVGGLRIQWTYEEDGKGRYTQWYKVTYGRKQFQNITTPYDIARMQGMRGGYEIDNWRDAGKAYHIMTTRQECCHLCSYHNLKHGCSAFSYLRDTGRCVLYDKSLHFQPELDEHAAADPTQIVFYQKVFGGKGLVKNGALDCAS